MNNNIEEKYVDFPNGKLLKEKGYKVHGYKFYTPNGKKEPYITYGSEYMSDEKCNADWNTLVPYPNKDEEVLCSAPTTSLAIIWIRENFGIHISVVFDYLKQNYNPHFVKKRNNHWEEFTRFSEIKNHERAENAAIHYTLTNLI